MTENQKVVLAYSGGLDTSVAIPWLKDKGYDVIACCINVGEGKDLDFIKQKALNVGAVKAYVIDALEEFAEDYAMVALQGHTFYEGEYPLISALSRPLISKKLVEVAQEENATAVAHGCTGKGNDQVRFEVAIHALNPALEVLSPVRDWHWSREEEIEYAKKHNIPIPIDLDSPYSIDANIWGRANEAGVLEDPWVSAPEDAYALTKPIDQTPDVPTDIEITFEQGVPTQLNGKAMQLADLIQELNQIAGENGIGRIDHIENRLVGIKSREVYEAPAATVLMKAHKQLEDLTFERDLAHFKPVIEKQLSEMIYNALWFSPLMDALLAFLKTTQEVVSGVIKVQLFKGNVITLGRKSESSLYDKNLATYTAADSFDQEAAKGFIKLWGLPTTVYSQVKMKNQQSAFVTAVTQNKKSKVKVAVKSSEAQHTEATK
ncbi:argininosuccinate synthase [Secundilactobacillus odoratitofui DSM 19909 = JCM 15043]|uniref:Argininosuccinate synthase n=1 Tax=Secundilactobacillus odoratitofui DSM 19909 = JCM 15043 TaxID=1423776 RepID=A0A0R1M2V9_9LACO|nr:argininosuccinate synthase [Secundilactobacillus odoratitofui]KRK98231.1 argininosuccinate synthase [Secundilactobacillus odoratitofui DSM 19909 = JCM 15043]